MHVSCSNVMTYVKEATMLWYGWELDNSQPYRWELDSPAGVFGGDTFVPQHGT